MADTSTPTDHSGKRSGKIHIMPYTPAGSDMPDGTTISYLRQLARCYTVTKALPSGLGTFIAN